MMAGTAAKLDVDDLGQLADAEIGVLGAQVYDGLPNGWRQGAMLVRLLVRCGAEEADHALLVESVSLAAQGPLIDLHLLGTLSGRIAKKYDRV
jgi:hypothetical protein